MTRGFWCPSCDERVCLFRSIWSSGQHISIWSQCTNHNNRQRKRKQRLWLVQNLSLRGWNNKGNINFRFLYFRFYLSHMFPHPPCAMHFDKQKKSLGSQKIRWLSWKEENFFEHQKSYKFKNPRNCLQHVRFLLSLFQKGLNLPHKKLTWDSWKKY